MRQVNKAVIPDKNPIPTINEFVEEFHGASLFRETDLRQGYLQIPLHEDSRYITAFVSHEGVYRFRRVAFGLASALSAFQRILRQSLSGLPGVAIYLDDIVVFGCTKPKHDSRLDTVFQIVRTKCHSERQEICFSQESIEFLGYKILTQGIHPIQSNTKAIEVIPKPTNAKELASFFGLNSLLCTIH